MYAITGITGQVGGAVADALLAAGQGVRAIVRDPRKAAAWHERGCEVALAAIGADDDALAEAFAGAEGVFVLLPPQFDPEPGFAHGRAMIAAFRRALEIARPSKVVCLSTIGAQAKESNLLDVLGMLEDSLGTLSIPIDFLRAAWFMENAAWDVAAARGPGVIRSFLQPLEKPVPMVATRDVGNAAARLLQERGGGRRVVELEGPQRVTPIRLAAAFSKALAREVRCEVVERARWLELFTAQGMKNPTPRARMLDGFNEGWIEFEDGGRGSIKGAIEVEQVVAQLVSRG